MFVAKLQSAEMSGGSAMARLAMPFGREGEPKDHKLLVNRIWWRLGDAGQGAYPIETKFARKLNSRILRAPGSPWVCAEQSSG